MNMLFSLSMPLCLVSLYIHTSYLTFKYDFIVTFSILQKEFINSLQPLILGIYKYYKPPKFLSKYFLTGKYPWWVWLVYIRNSPIYDGSR